MAEEEQQIGKSTGVSGSEGPQTPRGLSFETMMYYAQALDAVEHGGLFRTCRGNRVSIPGRNPWVEVENLKARARKEMLEGEDK